MTTQPATVDHPSIRPHLGATENNQVQNNQQRAPFANTKTAL
jgi:hypothetical protein